MKIVILEPYFTGSHAAWANEYKTYSRHQVTIVSLNGQYWKWRMHGGAVTLAGKYLSGTVHADLLLATDMLDLTTFLALTRQVSASTKTFIKAFIMLGLPLLVIFFGLAIWVRRRSRKKHIQMMFQK